MDEVILNDIPVTPHFSYVKGEDLAFLLIMIVAIATIIFLGAVLQQNFRRSGSFDILNSCWRIGQKRVNIWLSKHSLFNRTVKKTISILSHIGIYLLLTIFVLGFISVVILIFDDLFGIDKTYRRIVSKQHYGKPPTKCILYRASAHATFA